MRGRVPRLRGDHLLLPHRVFSNFTSWQVPNHCAAIHFEAKTHQVKCTQSGET